jgi:hypothetical protein
LGELYSLDELRLHKAARRSFGRWERRLGHIPAATDRVVDLPDAVLSRLAELDNEATLALYDLVLGVRDWGPGERFMELASKEKMEALDAFFFLADQVRFELMRRLGWLEGLAGERHSLLEMAARPLDIQAGFQPTVPRLTRRYHRFEELKQRLALEPGAVVRSLIPEALLIFWRRVAEGGAAGPQDPPGDQHP